MRGTLTLGGTNTYTGTTTVERRHLLVNGPQRDGKRRGDGASGGTLGGNGIVAGRSRSTAGGALAPGNPLGTLTVSNNLTLAAGSA